jgi:hypothetical protein
MTLSSTIINIVKSEENTILCNYLFVFLLIFENLTKLTILLLLLRHLLKIINKNHGTGTIAGVLTLFLLMDD